MELFELTVHVVQQITSKKGHVMWRVVLCNSNDHALLSISIYVYNVILIVWCSTCLKYIFKYILIYFSILTKIDSLNHTKIKLKFKFDLIILLGDHIVYCFCPYNLTTYQDLHAYKEILICSCH